MSSSLRRYSRYLPFVSLTLLTPVTQAGVSGLWKFDSATLTSAEGAIEGDGFSGNAQNLFIGAGSYYGRTNAFMRTNAAGPSPAGPWSVSTWFRTDVDTAITDTLFSWWASNNVECIFRSNASARFSLDVGDKSYIWRTPGSMLDQKWHHATVSSATGVAPYRLFIDGVETLNPQTGAVAAAPFNESYFIIGGAGDHYTTPARNWDGWIDDIGILNEAATPESDAAIYGFGKLGIGLSDYSAISALLASTPGTPIYLRGVLWEKTAGGLEGAAGASGGTVAGGDAYVVTGANGAGLKMSPPLATGSSLVFGPSGFTGTAGFGQKVVLPAQVSNTSTTGSLQWQVSGPAGQVSTLEGYARQLNANVDAILTPLGTRAASTGSPYNSSGNNLSAYGMNSYNLLQLPVFNDPTVRQLTTTDYTPGGPLQGQVRYTTLVRPDFSVLSADLTNIRSLTVSGNALSSAPTSSNTQLTVRGVTWKAWFYTVPGYQQQDIQHVFLTPADPGITFSANSTGEYATLTNLPAACRVHHLWFTTATGSAPTADTLQTFTRSFLELTHAPAGFISVAPPSGTLPPGGSADVTVTLDATGLAAGSYDGAFVVTARGENADAPGTIQRTAHLDVIAPQFAATGPATTLAAAVNELRHTDKILLSPVEGFTFGKITTASDTAWVRAVPSENRTGEVDLYIDATGLAEGTYLVNITITAGQTVRIVPVTITVATSRISKLLADPTRPRVYALSSSSNSSGSQVKSKILVLDSTTGKQVRELDAAGATAIALTPDASRIYAISGNPNGVSSVQWFDLQRLVAGGSFPLAQGASSYLALAAGSSHALYLTSTDSTSLVVQNGDTGAVIQTLAPLPAGQLFSSFCLSADGATLLANLKGTNANTLMAPALLRYAVQPDGSLVAAAADPTAVTTLPTGILRLSTTEDGRSIVSGDRVYNASRPAESVSFENQLWGISPGGEFVVGTSAFYSGDGRWLISDQNYTGLGSSVTVAITPEGRVFSSSGSSFRIFDTRATLGDDKAGYYAAPAAGATVATPATFRWLPVEGAREYHVYASRDAAALQGDSPAAETEIAVTRSYTLANPLATRMTGGETWYWRVDAAAPLGAVRGEVESFTLQTLATDRDHLDLLAVGGCTAQPGEVRILPAAGSATSTWTATSDQPWMTLTAATGSTADAVKVKVNTTLLTNGAGTATLTLQSGGATARIPVSIQTFSATAVDLATASDRNTAFAIVTGGQTGASFLPASLVRIDPATGLLVESRQLDSGARFLRISPDQTRIAVESFTADSTGSGSLEIFDTATLKPVAKLVKFGFSTYFPNFPTSALGPDDTASYGGRLVGSPGYRLLGARNDVNNSFPITAITADGKYLLGIGNSKLHKYDATSPVLTEVLTAPIGNFIAPGGVLTSKNPNAFALGLWVFDMNFNLIAQSPDGTINAINRDGTLVRAGNNGLYHFPSLRPLPAVSDFTTITAFDDRNSNLISPGPYNPNGGPSFTLTSYKDALRIDQRTLTPGTPEGALVGSNQLTLTWSDVASAGAYRVYLSTSLDEIETAEPGSPSEQGLTYGTSWKLANPLQPNTTYYWKLILEGPAGHVSSAEWSFHTSDFTLSEGTVAMLGPLKSGIMSHSIDLTAPAGKSWSVSSGTPWLTATGGGTGSGKITLTVDPANLTEGIATGIATLAIGGESVNIPVTFKSFTYRAKGMIADPDRSFMHLIVSPGLDQPSAVEPCYLVKIDMATHRAVDAIDLGFTIDTSKNLALVPSIHVDDDRIYLYNGAVQKFYGYNRSSYRLEKVIATADLAGFTSANWYGQLVSAGAGRMALSYPGVGIRIYSTADGALVSKLDRPPGQYGTYNSSMVSGPGGTRIYAVDPSDTSVLPQAFDISPAGIITAGPKATRLGNDPYFRYSFGLTGNRQQVYYMGMIYDRDLNTVSEPQPNDYLQIANGDGTLAGMTNGSYSYLVSTDGRTRYPLLPLSFYQTAIDPAADRFYFFNTNSDYSNWLEVLKPSSGAVPAVAGAGWVTYGPSTWKPDPARAGVLTLSTLRNVATSRYGGEAFLAFDAPVAGTLSFDWRSLTTGGERLSLKINDTERSAVTGTSAWQPRLITVAAGDHIVLDYLLAYNAAFDPNSSVELRSLAFTPAVSAATVAVGISPTADRDGDGFSDLIEAALGTDPGSAASRPVAGLVMNGATAAAYAYERPASSTYDFTVQVSQDLVTWQDLPAENATVTAVAAATPGGTARQRVTMPLPATGTRGFTRLKVAETATK